MIDDKIKTFIKVVECQNYTQAANLLHLTQPAVTQHIKALESYYQHKLIDHPHKSFRLTKAGEMLYNYARIQLHNEELFEEMIIKHSTPLTIGATLSIADYYIPALLAPVLISSKQEYQIIVANTQNLIQEMMNGKVECAFVEGHFDADLFDYHLFKEERFIPVVRSTHPLANQNISFKDLFPYPLFVREKGSGTRAILEDYLNQTLYQFHSFHHCNEIGNLSMIKTLLLHTDGITFVYEGVVAEELKRGQLKELQLADFEITRPMHFIYLKSNINRLVYQQFFKNLMKNREVSPSVVDKRTIPVQ